MRTHEKHHPHEHFLTPDGYDHLFLEGMPQEGIGKQKKKEGAPRIREPLPLEITVATKTSDLQLQHPWQKYDFITGMVVLE